MGVMLALALIATIACLKLSKPTKFLIRTQSWIAALIAIVVVANIICTGHAVADIRQRHLDPGDL